jgi:hypothetical protein
MDEGKTPFAGWVVLEMMGHQRAVGFCTEVDIFGTKMARLETPAYADKPIEVRYVSASALYAVTETTEEAVRAELDQLARYLAPRQRLLLERPVSVEEDPLDQYGEPDEGDGSDPRDLF